MYQTQGQISQRRRHKVSKQMNALLTTDCMHTRCAAYPLQSLDALEPRINLSRFRGFHTKQP